MKRVLLVVGGIVVAGLLAVGAVYVFAPSWILQYAPNRAVVVGGLARSYVDSLFAPPGVTTTQFNLAYRAAPAPPASNAAPAAADDWPSYNKTLTSERFSPLAKIDTTNVRHLKVLCTYDTGSIGAFESGLIVVNGALIGTTEFDIFSINPGTCALNWRTHETYPGAANPVNRGAAYMDGMLYRGTQDGRVLAYDLATGKRIWATGIADPSKGESAPAAPIAWNGLVFIGNAGGDYKGGKGHIFALDGKTGKVVWEFFTVPRTAGDAVRGPLAASPLDNASWRNSPGMPISGGGSWTSYTLDPTTGLLYVPIGNPAPDFAIGVREGQDVLTDSIVVLDAKTGAYRKHYKLVPRDWHDWDASNPPALIHTQAGRSLMAAAPKDGYLYGYNLADDRLLYRVPATRIENVDEPFSPDKKVHFCPGAVGGDEWNSPGYDPQLNLIFVGDVDWCTTVHMQTDGELARVPDGQPWMGDRFLDAFNEIGKQSRADGVWRGWIHAVDADTGVWKWRLQSNYPIVGGVTPTAGGVLFFGDVGGYFYAVDAASGARLWGQKIGGAIGGGVITYTVNGAQRVAVATGFINAFWPVQVTSGKIVILGVDGA